ncbi:uncharacterized protein ATNIH1004_005486 [Aspergillus tanneri]|uniref:Uncharacterized protein n=1 Tax=Aspergillus tanneri TaxID=1220188 RepID=A0A5M9MIH9_9EURO|nr:uncharacterized protein ATNIH1004_005486 [Aspergillus tanneri]KAA8646811.1 hypothetical protein ATNIH1004_005486 [Aspergillus tanneri]
MKASTIVYWALLGLGSAENAVVSMFLPEIDPQWLAASIVDGNAAATTYSLCGHGTDGFGCGGGVDLTAVQGPKTAGWFFSLSQSDVFVSHGCSVGGTTTATCIHKVSGTGAVSPGVKTDMYAQTEMEYYPVTITAGSVSSVAATAALTSSSSLSDHSVATSVAGRTSKESSSPAIDTATATATPTSAGSMLVVTRYARITVCGAFVSLLMAAV